MGHNMKLKGKREIRKVGTEKSILKGGKNPGC